MPDLTSQRTAPEPQPVAQHGTVTEAPAAIGAAMRVNVPDFSGDHFYEIHRWSSRAATLPAVGDEVLVVKDEDGEAWVCSWWPAGGDVGVKAVVIHGDDPHAPRPGGAISVEWQGSVEPLNAIDDDTWINPS